MCNRAGLVWQLAVKWCPSLIRFGHGYIDGLFSPVSIVKLEKGIHLPEDLRDRAFIVEHVVEVKEASIEAGIANRCDDCIVAVGKSAHIDTWHRAVFISGDGACLKHAAIPDSTNVIARGAATTQPPKTRIMTAIRRIWHGNVRLNFFAGIWSDR
jgi:hypothetical protein